VTDADLLARILPRARWPRLEPDRLALLVIDLQQLCAAPGRGMFATAEQLGHPEALAPYRHRLERVVLPNVIALIDACRDVEIPVVYTRIESRTPDGSERSACHRALGLHVPPGHDDGRILPVIEPLPGEVIVSKTTSDAFIGTDLRTVLAERGVRHLAVVGVLTNECVESTVRHAADLDLTVHLVEDGCAAVHPAWHDASIRTLGQTYARVIDTSQLLAAIDPMAS